MKSPQPKKRGRQSPVGQRPKSRAPAALLAAGFVLVALLATWQFRSHRPSSASPAPRAVQPRPRGSITFNHDIGPLIFQNCSPCHRPGQPAPFTLLSFADVKKHASDIANVTQRRYMPPWLPAPGSHQLLGDRRLSDEQIALVQQWVQEGAPEGDASQRPAPPVFTEGWQLGTPDLVGRMPQPYVLPAEGPDVYRNFVIPLAVDRRRFIRALEFKAGTKVLHHVFFYFDRTQQSARVDARDAEVGFAGMALPPGVDSPGGHFVTWQPGRGPNISPAGLPWSLEAGSSVVLQAHMQPSGKAEEVQPSVAFYFADEPPTNSPFKIALDSYAIDIPAGASNYIVEDSFTLPVDVQVLAVLPHAHHLGKQIDALAILPDGRTDALLSIPAWDFNWQSDFRFRSSVPLPKGTRLAMRWIYDNSTNNARNPNHPPVRVKYGSQSSDEMGELYFQVLARSAADLAILEQAYQQRVLRDILEYNTLVLEREPTNAHAHVQLGKALVGIGKIADATHHFRRAIALDSRQEEAHYHLGVVLMDRNTASAADEFTKTLELNPDNFKARVNLGIILMNDRRFDEAEAQFNAGLRSNPGDPILLKNLAILSELRAK